MSIKILTVNIVKDINKEVVAIAHEDYGVLNEGLLEQSVNSVLSAFGEYELYPTLLEKVAQLCYSLCKNHCFTDGNKRTAVIAMLMFLDTNGMNVSQINHNTLAELIWNVADGSRSRTDILNYLKTIYRNVGDDN